MKPANRRTGEPANEIIELSLSHDSHGLPAEAGSHESNQQALISPIRPFTGFTNVALYSVLIASIGLTEAALRAGR